MDKADLEERVERHRGDVAGSVSGNTDDLVVGENPGTTKREDDEANDVPEIGPEEFFETVEDRGVDVWR